MGVAVGLGAALARTAPPPPPSGGGRAITPAESLTGYPLPPEPDLGRWLTTWQPDLLWLILCGLGLVLYLAGVRRLVVRGDRWPVGRTICWVLGLLVVFWVTCGGPAAYGHVLFSAHMVMHMMLAMVVPLLLVLGAPVTLALRRSRRARTAPAGPAEWLLAVLALAGAAAGSFDPVAAAICSPAAWWSSTSRPCSSWR